MMGRDDHRRAEALVRRTFEAGVGAAEDRWLRTHLAGCAGCRGLYERYAEAERALHRTSEGLSPAALERVERRVLASAAVGEPSSPGAWASASQWLAAAREAGRARVGGGALALALATSALVLGVLPRSEPAGPGLLDRGAAPADDQLRARGEPTPTPLGFRLLSVRGAEGQAPVVADVRPGEAVPADARLVALTTTESGPLEVRLEATVDGRAQPWVTRLATAGVDTKLGESLALPEAWRGKVVELRARFVDAAGRAVGESVLTLRVEPR